GLRQPEVVQRSEKVRQRFLAYKTNEITLVYGDAKFVSAVLVDDVSKLSSLIRRNISQRDFHIYAVIPFLLLSEDVGLLPGFKFLLVDYRPGYAIQFAGHYRWWQYIAIDLVRMNAQSLALLFEQLHKALKAEVFEKELKASLHAPGSFSVAIEHPQHALDEWNDLVFVKEIVNRNCQVRISAQPSTDIDLKAALVVAYLRYSSNFVYVRIGRVVVACAERYLELPTHVLANRVAQEIFEGLVGIRRHIERFFRIHASCRGSRYISYCIAAGLADGYPVLFQLRPQFRRTVRSEEHTSEL